MNLVDCLITPISAIVDLDSLGMVSSARIQLRRYTLGDVLLVTDYFTRHDRLNQVGAVLIEKLRKAVEETDEYKTVMKNL